VRLRFDKLNHGRNRWHWLSSVGLMSRF
jgi:hypothetical protein